MNRRELYRSVAELARAAGGQSVFLAGIVDAMRLSRNQPASPLPAWLSGHLPQLTPLLAEEDALGTFYQALNAPALEAAYRATARQGRKFSADEIPAVTQLFTPRWVVDFLLQNSLGRLWLEWHPDSALAATWPWLVPPSAPPGPSPFLSDRKMGRTPSKLARDIRLCDPACGTMNFGLAALDMLRQIYREEIADAGKPSWPTEPSCPSENQIDRTILSHNLAGYDIDPIALDLARICFELKTGLRISPAEWGLHQRDSLLGESEGETQKFDIIVTNPPYLSARNLDPKIVKRLKKHYPSAWRDFYACFIVKSLSMLSSGGRLGILCMQSFMFTSAFERLRTEIAATAALETLAHFGPGLFGIGNPGTLQTAAAVFSRPPCTSHAANCFRLTDVDDKESALRSAIAARRERTSENSPLPNRSFQISHADLASLPRSAWMYWISPALRRTFTAYPPLSQIALPRQGLATTDNARFVRYWWEVELPGHSSPRTKWIPYAKGGGFRRWYEAARYRVNWENDGQEIKASIVSRYPYLDGQWQWVAKNATLYGKPGITYSYLSAGRFSARQLQEGAIFDVAGSAMFPENPLPLLGVLNSSTAAQLLQAINPTINFQVGDLAQLPVPTHLPDELNTAVARAVHLTRQLDTFDETSTDFEMPAPLSSDDSTANGILRELSQLEAAIDQMVADAYGVEFRQTAHLPPKLDPQDLARRWISYALGIHLGRWPGKAALRSEPLVLSPLSPKLRDTIREILTEHTGDPTAAAQIESTAGGLDRFFAREFSSWHTRLYRGKPVFWTFGNSACLTAIHAPFATPDLMNAALKPHGATLPPAWNREIDDGIAINLAPLADHVADPKLATALRKIHQDVATGRYAFAKTKSRINQILLTTSP
jgi:hypothetical protein